MISVPVWLAVVIVIVGGALWLAELPKKARRRREAQAARAKLRADLAGPPRSAQLPYGLTMSPYNAEDEPKQ